MDEPARRVLRAALLVTLSLGCVSLVGCVTVGNFRREMKELEQRVLARQQSTPDVEPSTVADLAARMDALQAEMRSLSGRLEVAEKTAADALAESRRARQELAARSAADADAETGSGTAVAVAPTAPAEPAPSAELVAYREAYAAWREERLDECIDRFRKFLQTYPSSSYADDAVFWTADCYFKQGDFKNATIRFDDVVKSYPDGNKAPEALYRQGESLLRLGPGYTGAARRAFERVVSEYPDSDRAPEAKRQIEGLAAR